MIVIGGKMTSTQLPRETQLVVNALDHREMFLHEVAKRAKVSPDVAEKKLTFLVKTGFVERGEIHLAGERMTTYRWKG